VADPGNFNQASLRVDRAHPGGTIRLSTGGLDALMPAPSQPARPGFPPPPSHWRGHELVSRKRHRIAATDRQRANQAGCNQWWPFPSRRWCCLRSVLLGMLRNTSLLARCLRPGVSRPCVET